MWAFEVPRRLNALALIGAALALPGCAVVTVAGAVVSTGVKVTGKVLEKTIDAVTPDSKPAP